MTKQKVSFFWFRRDLRLEDNTGLFHALQSDFPVIPLFVFDEDILDNLPKNDARVTKVGAFIRRTSIDELPQLLNILLGDMSIVGPRPHAVGHNQQYRLLVRGYMLRHKMKPGLTGWAQIHGFRGETDTIEKMEMRVQYDLEYLRNWTPILDIYVIFKNNRFPIFETKQVDGKYISVS